MNDSADDRSHEDGAMAGKGAGIGPVKASGSTDAAVPGRCSLSAPSGTAATALDGERPRTVSPQQCPHWAADSARILPLTSSPLTESNRRPSPYHHHHQPAHRPLYR